MIEFLDLHIYLRVIILLVLLILTTMNFCTFINLVTRKSLIVRKVVLLVFSITSLIMLIYFSSMQYATVYGMPFENYGFSHCFMATVPVCVVNICYLVCVYFDLNRTKKSKISPFSVKESFDNLPTGLCFSKKNGMVQLVNYQMNRLSYLLTGSDLQNADAFWKMVSDGELDDDVKRLVSGDKPEILFKDGRVWSFAKENIDSVIQITATDVTEYHLLTDTIEEKNSDLQKMNERLRKYGENVDEVTRSKERLETKVRIHNEFGQALIVTRYALQNDADDLESMSEVWKRSIAVLRMEAEPVSGFDHITALMNAAESAGVSVEIKGRMPRKKEAKMLVMAAATETLTNAVRHAEAKKLLIEIDETSDAYIACFTNDGKIPDSAVIVEGGGLSSLRKKVERANGEMYVSGSPVFALTIKIYKESGDMV